MFIPNLLSAESGGEIPLRARIAIVEDEPDLREAVAEYLGANGYDVVQAADAAEMRALAAVEPFHLAILDIAMPGEDGISLIGRIRAREQDRHLPAIALTAHASATLRRQALSAGFDVFLAKPVDPVLLFETIDRLAAVEDRDNA